MLKGTAVRCVLAIITLFVTIAANSRQALGGREPSCDELGDPLIVCNEATCAQTSEWTMEVSCWWKAQTTAILQEEWSWYEQNCVLDYECNSGAGTGCEEPENVSHIECWWHH
jgi:hypothetical protein